MSYDCYTVQCYTTVQGHTARCYIPLISPAPAIAARVRVDIAKKVASGSVVMEILRGIARWSDEWSDE